MNLYIANIAFNATEDQLREVFASKGEVSSVKIITDRVTQKPRGFGFVEMPNDEEGRAAIAEINGFDFLGRPLKVNEARPRENSFSGRPRNFDR